MKGKCCDKCEELKTDPERVSKVRNCMIKDDEAIMLSDLFKVLGTRRG